MKNIFVQPGIFAYSQMVEIGQINISCSLGQVTTAIYAYIQKCGQAIDDGTGPLALLRHIRSGSA
jgi:hypothetical protein